MGIHFTHGDFNGNFLKKVIKTRRCWIWAGSIKGPYGLYQKSYAHRVSYSIFKGGIPAGLSVLHRCDQTLCVNPEHLFLGTQQDNITDAQAKGRLARGSKQGLSKLTDADVRCILWSRRLGMTQTALAKRFGVCQATIYEILSGKNWTHIQRTW